MHRILLSSILLALAVLLAGNPAQAFTPQSPKPAENVYKLLESRQELSKFVGMVNEAGLKDVLSATDEPLTVFAPTNDALSAIPHDASSRINASKTSLQSFVKYHIINGSMVPSSAIRGRRASPAAANGEMLQFDGSDRNKPPMVNGGNIIQSDLQAMNGVVHTVSTALVPPSMLEAPKPAVAPANAEAAPVPVPATPAAAETTTATPEGSAPAAASETTTATPAAATTSSKPRFVTTGVAKAKPPATPPTPPPATDDGSGFTLFGHKFGW